RQRPVTDANWGQKTLSCQRIHLDLILSVICEVQTLARRIQLHIYSDTAHRNDSPAIGNIAKIEADENCRLDVHRLGRNNLDDVLLSSTHEARIALRFNADRQVRRGDPRLCAEDYRRRPTTPSIRRKSHPAGAEVSNLDGRRGNGAISCVTRENHIRGTDIQDWTIRQLPNRNDSYT